MRTVKQTVLVIILALFCCTGCSSWDFSVKKTRHDKHHISAMEANLDDELNATEREAVAPIFENNAKEKRRSEREVFGM